MLALYLSANHSCTRRYASHLLEISVWYIRHTRRPYQCSAETLTANILIILLTGLRTRASFTGYYNSRHIRKFIHNIVFLPQVPGQFLSLFYTDRLGLYPHVDLTSRTHFNGGIPQRGNLKASMNKARADINYYIPSK